MGPSGRQVSDSVVERDLKFLLAVLNWAAKSRDEQGRLLLETNPLRGLKLPEEKNPDPGTAHSLGIRGTLEAIDRVRALVTGLERLLTTALRPYGRCPGSTTGNSGGTPSGQKPRNGLSSGRPHRVKTCSRSSSWARN